MQQRTGVILLALLSAVGLLGLGLFLFSREPVPRPPPPTATPTLPALTEEHVARVNQALLTREELANAYAIDHALSTLLGQPTPTVAEVAERQINAALVLQAAEAAGFAFPSERASPEDFAADQPFDSAALTTTLAHYGVSTTAFADYYERLRRVDRFTHHAAQQRGTDVSEYVGELRAEGAVEIFPSNLPQLTPPPPTATPQPTPTPTAVIERGTSSGDVAPDFELPTLSGAPERLTWADLRGAPTVLSFWVTWCGHCRSQTPRLVAAYERYADQGIQFVGVNIKEAPEKVQAYVENQQIPYPMTLDTDGVVAGRYGVHGLPTTYFLDGEGRIVARHVGELQEKTLERYVTELSETQ